MTSGGYERYVEISGQKYHHIIDPRTGYPSQSDLKSVTIICENSAQADALSTAIFVMGLDFGVGIIKQYPELQAVFVCQNNHIYISQGLRNRFLLHHNTQYRCFLI